MTAQVVTFGCRLNAYESEVIRDNATKAGLTDAIVFNTCAVTAEAERQARQAIRRARKENPNATIIVTGCSAQVKPENYAKMPEVDCVIGNEEKLRLDAYTDYRHSERSEESYRDPSPSAQDNGRYGHAKIFVNDIMSVKETALHLVSGFEGHARAFVQVQNGCDHRCTFCIIPYGRGNSRSVPMGEIATQVRSLVEKGYKEVVLTGVDVSDYGKDLPGAPTLGQMMRRLLALIPELPRLRLSSIDAVEVDADLYRLIAEEPRLMPHIHVSLQAGDDMILKRMKRRHSRKDALDFCARVRELRPDVVFGADIIAGFPTETDAMFQNTLNVVKEAGLTWLHVFPYSAREGTPAAKMPQVAKPIRKERANRLREAGEKQVQQFLSSCVGKEVCGVVEQGGIAHTEHFAPVKLSQAMAVGTLARLRVTHADATHLYGVAA
jgi:threonylcarbamoyladenosine tRNA methylthiotransferase MtaB